MTHDNGDPLLADFVGFCERLGTRLRPYQVEPAQAILRSVLGGLGLTFTVMFARQMGKNELSAHLEAYLMARGMWTLESTLVKAAPTFKPQVIVSKTRLENVLSASPALRPFIHGQWGYIVKLGLSRCTFFSGDPNSNVKGETARLLLEVDEAQDFEKDKYQRDFRPMAAVQNATTVLYGTGWAEDDLLAAHKRVHLEMEAGDGIRRHFEYPWHYLAELNPAYGRFVEGERARLGPEHPLFLSEYELVPIPGVGRLLTPALAAQLAGDHPRLVRPWGDRAIVAGLDIAGEGNRGDYTVLTIAEVELRTVANIVQSVGRVVQHYEWRGADLSQLQLQLADLLANVWHCRRVAVDATGIGAGVSSFLARALGPEGVDQVVFTQAGKSRLGYDLLAAIGSGRLRMYADDGSAEYRALMEQVKSTKREVLPGQALRWETPAGEGHDDYISSLALVVRALDGFTGTPAAEISQAPDVLDWKEGWEI